MRNKKIDDFASNVRSAISVRIERAAVEIGITGNVIQLMPGKMLRTKLGARLMSCSQLPACVHSVELACAATEMAHTASLLHDDLIDHAVIRRRQPALWKIIGASAAVLIGDRLLCESMEILLDIEEGRYARKFVTKLREVCSAEAEHELLLKNRPLDRTTCLRIAKGKTGPLFAFVGQMCGGKDETLSSALEEAGYNIGAAYQIADDLLDVVGSENTAGKTLRTDRTRGKFTLAQHQEQGQQMVSKYILTLSTSALDCLDPWPHVREVVSDFLTFDLQPLLDRHLGSAAPPVRLAV